jgi:hypothetical protein
LTMAAAPPSAGSEGFTMCRVRMGDSVTLGNWGCGHGGGPTVFVHPCPAFLPPGRGRRTARREPGRARSPVATAMPFAATRTAQEARSQRGRMAGGLTAFGGLFGGLVDRVVLQAAPMLSSWRRRTPPYQLCRKERGSRCLLARVGVRVVQQALHEHRWQGDILADR